MASNGGAEESVVPRLGGETKPTKAKCFLGLPLELRVMIYQRHFDKIPGPTAPILLPCQRGAEFFGMPGPCTALWECTEAFAIFRVSRQVHLEATTWFYENKQFVVRDLGLSTDWATTYPLRATYLGQIRSLQVLLDVKDFEDWTQETRALLQPIVDILKKSADICKDVKDLVERLEELQAYLQPFDHPHPFRSFKFHLHPTMEKTQIASRHRALNELYFWGATMRTIRHKMPKLRKLSLDITRCSSVDCANPAYRTGTAVINWGIPNDWKYAPPELGDIIVPSTWHHEIAQIRTHFDYQAEMTRLSLAAVSSNGNNGTVNIGGNEQQADDGTMDGGGKEQLAGDGSSGGSPDNSSSTAPTAAEVSFKLREAALRQVSKLFCCPVGALPTRACMQGS